MQTVVRDITAYPLLFQRHKYIEKNINGFQNGETCRLKRQKLKCWNDKGSVSFILQKLQCQSLPTCCGLTFSPQRKQRESCGDLKWCEFVAIKT